MSKEEVEAAVAKRLSRSHLQCRGNAAEQRYLQQELTVRDDGGPS
jgi:hypothetical protein